MTAVRVRFGVELESALCGVDEVVVKNILSNEGLNVKCCYYDSSVYGCLWIFDALQEIYYIGDNAYCDDESGLEIVLKSSMSITTLKENIELLADWVEHIGLDYKTVFSPNYGAGGHVHFSSINIKEVYSNYINYVEHNEIALKLLALYTAYALCSDKTYERNYEYRDMYLNTRTEDTKFQFIRIVNINSRNEHVELRVMDSIYDIEKYIDYLKLIRVFVRNTIDTDFNKAVVSEILDISDFSDESDLNDYIVNTYTALIDFDREVVIERERDTLEKMLTTFIESMNFKFVSFKNKLFSYL